MNKYISIPVVGLVVAILGIGTPILWDWFQSRRSLEVRIVSYISLLETDPIVDGVVVSYKGNQIDNLTKYVLRVSNTGSQPISEDEVISFPKIAFQGAAKVISTEVIHVDPTGLAASLETDADKKTVKAGFQLLNPTDYFELAIYIDGPSKSAPKVSGRIKGIKTLNVVDLTESIPDATESRRQRGWAFYTVGGFTIFGYLVCFAMLAELKQQFFLKRRLRNEPSFLDALQTRSEFEEFILGNMDFPTSTELAELRELLKTWDDVTDEDQLREQLRMRIRHLTNNSNAAFGGGLFIAFLVLVGTYYVFN